jgi:demethylmenaquinone methyltransferase/2-methoxy-6-polyprenyl-1,4-benzoquinol methylase
VVLDLACGTGDLCRELQRNGLEPVGVDLSHGMLAAARTTAPLAQGDALGLPVPDAAVDGATCGFALRNFLALEPFFAELARVVRPGGRIALLEVAEPANPLLRVGHGIYFGKVVPRIGGLLSDGAAYRYLPKSVAYLPPPEALLDALAGAGFSGVDRTLLSGGIAQLITATRTQP